jgi:hypothetical protein
VTRQLTRIIVVDRLRHLWNRPLRDGDRPRLFLIAIVLIAAAAAVLTQLDGPSPAPRAHRAATSTVTKPQAPAAAPALTPDMERGEPSEEGTRTVVHPARTDVTTSKRAARRFLACYLPYTYGRVRARAIQSATGELQRRLVAQRLRVPAGERHRVPRLALLQSNSVGPRHAELLALVDDGKRRYTIALELIRTATGWRVTRVGA